MQDVILGIHEALWTCIAKMLKLLKMAPANMGVAPRPKRDLGHISCEVNYIHWQELMLNPGKGRSRLEF